MKLSSVIFTFLGGVVAASFFWWMALNVGLQKYPKELVARDLGRLEEEAIVSEHIMSYLDHPDPVNREYLSVISSNALTHFSANVDLWDKRFPQMQIKLRYKSKSENLQKYWLEREARAAKNSTAGDRK